MDELNTVDTTARNYRRSQWRLETPQVTPPERPFRKEELNAIIDKRLEREAQGRARHGLTRRSPKRRNWRK